LSHLLEECHVAWVNMRMGLLRGVVMEEFRWLDVDRGDLVELVS
jgi:hypothetical protein